MNVDFICLIGVLLMAVRLIVLPPTIGTLQLKVDFKARGVL
jgi:hypothetical protein